MLQSTTTKNKAKLRKAYEEASKGNGQLLLDTLADDITWTVIGTTALSGVAHGKGEVVEKIFKPLRARLATGVEFAIDRVFGEDGSVALLARGKATAKGGKPYNNTYCIIARFENGKIKEMTDYIDTELITSALG